MIRFVTSRSCIRVSDGLLGLSDLGLAILFAPSKKLLLCMLSVASYVPFAGTLC